MPCSMLFKWTLVLRLPGELFSGDCVYLLSLNYDYLMFLPGVSLKYFHLKKKRHSFAFLKRRGGRSLSLVAVRAR